MLSLFSRRAFRIWGPFKENSYVRDCSVLEIETLGRLGFQTHAISRDSEKASDLCAYGTRMRTDFRRGQNEA